MQKFKQSLFYKIFAIFILIGVTPALLISLRLLTLSSQLLSAPSQPAASGEIPGSSAAGIEDAAVVLDSLQSEATAYLIYTFLTVGIFAIFASGSLLQPIRKLKLFLQTGQAVPPVKVATGASVASTLGHPSTLGPQASLGSEAGEDEIGYLNLGITQMTQELHQLRQDLQRQTEERAQDLDHRTRQLQAASAVAQNAATIRDLDQLLSRATELISENFGYYHTGIFLIDANKENAVLRAANSPGGKQMLARGHKLNITTDIATSIVGFVANTHQPRLASSVGADAVHFKNLYLPDTRSEMALPLVVGDRLWGILDMQSASEAAFTEGDIAVLQILANQIAIAIENAQLFVENKTAMTELQTALETSRNLYGELTREAWRKLLQSRPDIGYLALGGEAATGMHSAGGAPTDLLTGGRTEILPITGPWQADMLHASQTGQAVQLAPHNLLIPIKIRDYTAGVLRLRKADNSSPWSRSEIDLMSALSDQLSVALESARLYDETRRRAERERLTSEITAKVRASNDPRTILETAMSELRQALQASHTQITLHSLPIEQPETPSSAAEPHP